MYVASTFRRVSQALEGTSAPDVMWAGDEMGRSTSYASWMKVRQPVYKSLQRDDPEIADGERKSTLKNGGTSDDGISLPETNHHKSLSVGRR